MAITTAVIAAAIKPVIESLIALVKAEGGRQLDSYTTKKALNSVASKLTHLNKVRTVFAKDACISDFYVPAKLIDDQTRIRGEDVLNKYSQDHLLITGIGGQGKSIFLKNLALVEAKAGRFLPLFIEFKRLGEIDPKESLSSFLIRSLDRFGFPQSEEVLFSFIKSEKGLFLLDAFDELQLEHRIRVARELDDLIAKHPNIKIIVTSRPDTEITNLPLLKTLRVDYVSEKDRQLLIKKIYAEEKKDLTKALDEALRKNPSVTGILITPLIIALLTVTFDKDVNLPDTLSNFYERVFEAMLVRHDSAKLLQRPRKCGLVENQFRMVFESFCAVSLNLNQSRLSKAVAIDHLKRALSDAALNTSLADDVFDDIVNITSLLVRDGDSYDYVHKTIQEYFAACYIKRLPSSKVEKFFKGLSRKTVRYWSTALTFLQEIDKYRYYYYFEIPRYKDFFGPLYFSFKSNEDLYISLDDFERLYTGMEVHANLNSDTGRLLLGYGFSHLNIALYNSTGLIHVPMIEMDRLTNELPAVTSSISSLLNAKEASELEDRNNTILVRDILKNSMTEDIYLQRVGMRLHTHISKLKDWENFILLEENKGEFLL